MEYQPFGTKLVQRESEADEWVEVPDDDFEIALQAIRAEQVRTLNQSGRSVEIRIIRSESTEAAAAQLGLSGDELAENLLLDDRNEGTRQRLPEREFDALMKDIGFDPKEARERFKGTYRDDS